MALIWTPETSLLTQALELSLDLPVYLATVVFQYLPSDSVNVRAHAIHGLLTRTPILTNASCFEIVLEYSSDNSTSLLVITQDDYVIDMMLLRMFLTSINEETEEKKSKRSTK